MPVCVYFVNFYVNPTITMNFLTEVACILDLIYLIVSMIMLDLDYSCPPISVYLVYPQYSV